MRNPQVFNGNFPPLLHRSSVSKIQLENLSIPKCIQMQPLLELQLDRHAPIFCPFQVIQSKPHLKVIFNEAYLKYDNLPKIESLSGDRASKNGNVTKNHRLKNALNVMHFHDDGA